MQKFVIVLTLVLTWAGALILMDGNESPTPEKKPATIAWPAGLPVYDHVVIVMEENKDYDQIIDNANAPYINSLAKAGANFTKMYAEEHNSEGNYFWFFSGNN